MKPVTALFLASLAANLVLGGKWLLRSESAPAVSRPQPAKTLLPAPPTLAEGATAKIPTAETESAASDPMALRDRLRALGFSEAMMQVAVRATLEAPRLARERAFREADAKAPWWRAATTFTAAQNRELRELRKTERAEIARVLGPGADATTEERERYAYLPEDKAARLAVLERDYREMRRELATGPGAPATRAETLEREKLLTAEHDRDLAALLSPEEREMVELRTSNAAFSIGLNARYFSGTAEEFGTLYRLSRDMEAQRALVDAGPMETRARSGIDISQKYQKDLEEALGHDRYRDWQRARQVDQTTLMELQRRFAVPSATIDAVKAVLQAVSDEGMAIGQDQSRRRDDKPALLLELANSARTRVRAVLGPDLGDAYNEASARGWLDYLERGSVPFVKPNGEMAIFGVGNPGRGRTPSAPAPNPTPQPKK
jgi:hypothetical protein